MRKLFALLLLFGVIALISGCANVTAAGPQQSKGSASPLNLVNAGFEEAGAGGPEGWTKGASIAGVEYVWDRSVAHSGKASLGFKKTQNRYFPTAGWSQRVRNSGSASKLRVTCWIKADQAYKAILDVGFDGSGGWSHSWAAYIGAQSLGDDPADHDWKEYTGVVEIPAGTQEISIVPQMYGPGTVWFDDIEAEYVDDDTPTSVGGMVEAPKIDDGSKIPSNLVRAEGNRRMRYFLMGPQAEAAEPEDGYRLLIVLPGGDGGPDFEPFVKRIFANSLDSGYVVAEAVAPKWSEKQFERVVWPTRLQKWREMEFPTEEFIESIVKDVKSKHKIDSRYVFLLGWSSSGPPVYASALAETTSVTGVFVAMSVYKPNFLPPEENAKGRPFYILHSAEDFIPISMAKDARDRLGENGAKVEFKTYAGGHGWHGDVFGMIRTGIEWLELQQE